MSFTVFARARPIRTAFLLNEVAGFDAICDGLVRWSNDFWGGRRSVVALLEKDGTIDPDIWQEMVQFDPDRVNLLTPVSEELLVKIDAELSPWHISQSKDREDAGPAADEREVSIDAPGVRIPPTKLALDVFQNRPLLIFGFTKDCPYQLRRFIHRNLGAYQQWFDLQTSKPRPYGWLEDMLAKVAVEHVLISDLQSLCAAMEQISGTPPRPNWKPPHSFTAPCELSGAQLLPHFRPRGAFGHLYRVVVGSKLQDFLLYWRSCLNEGDGAWDAPYRHCLWIPTELVREVAFVAALKNWLYYFTGQASSGSRTVEVTSASLTADELSPLINACCSGNVRVPTQFVKAEDVETRWKNERARHDTEVRQIGVLNGDNVQRLVAVERAQAWELQPPKAIQSEAAMGTWAVDVKIEREAREDGIQGQDWWFLPRNSSRGLVASMFRAPSRISRNGLFAIQIERTSVWPGAQPPARLQLQLPDDRDVVRGILLIKRETWFDYSDVRRERLLVKPIVTNMEISDAGRKLRGLIGLFGGFWRARDYWERAFWRGMFCQMAMRGARYDSGIRSKTEQAIQKELQKHGIVAKQKPAADMAQKIAHRLLNDVAKRYRDIPMTFATMKELREQAEISFKANQQANGTKAIQYLAGNTVVHMSGVEPVSEEDLKNGVEELVSLGVLRMGMNVCCPRCRLQHWLHTENLQQSSPCPGCGAPMPVIPETVWSYRLNPLIHHCVNQNVLSVWQSLQEVSHRLGSFFFAPSSELNFAQSINGKFKKEIDVLCVTDGELLLGEVKTGPLAESDFKEFAAVVAAIRPELAAVFVESEYFDKLAQNWFENFKRELKPCGVQGQLFCLTSY
jgi:hypothetical protein